MAYTSNPYCQLSDVKSVLGKQTTTDDDWLTSMIPQAQDMIDNELGYSFQTDGTSSQPATRVFSGNGSRVLFTGWIVSISQVVEQSYSLAVAYDGFYDIGTSITNDITQDCVIGPENYNPGWQIERLSWGIFEKGRRNYIVSGVFGVPTIPPSISRACARIVSHWYKMRDTNYADTLAEQGNVRQKYTKQLPADVVEILDNYRLHRFYSR
jgi:hypothetical protein